MRRTELGLIIGALSGVLTGIVLAVVGGVLAFSGQIAVADVEPPENGVTTTAIVVGSVERRVLIDGIARPSFSPVYEYEDVAGDVHRVTDHISSESRPPAVGSTVEISYLPGDPESVRRTDVDDDWLRWLTLGGWIAAGVGATIVFLSLVVGAAALISRRRRMRVTR